MTKRNPTLADALRAARYHLRLTQGEFGALVGVAIPTLGRWEGGDAPGPRTGPHIVTALASTELPRELLSDVIDALGLTQQFAVTTPIAKHAPSASSAPEAAGAAPRVEPLSALAALDYAIYVAADRLGVPARPLRDAFVDLLGHAQLQGLTLEQARTLLVRSAAPLRTNPTPRRG